MKFNVNVMMFVTIAIFIAAVYFDPCRNERPYDSTDKPPARSGVSVVVDELTGCHYLRTRLGGISPRLGADGKQLCGVEVPR